MRASTVETMPDKYQTKYKKMTRFDYKYIMVGGGVVTALFTFGTWYYGQFYIKSFLAGAMFGYFIGTALEYMDDYVGPTTPRAKRLAELEKLVEANPQLFADNPHSQQER